MSASLPTHKVRAGSEPKRDTRGPLLRFYKWFKHSLAYYFVRALFALAALLPQNLVLQLGRVLGLLAWALVFSVRRLVGRQLAKRLDLPGPASARLARRVFVHLGENFAEWLLLHRWRRHFEQHVEVNLQDLNALTTDLLKGRGVVLASAHIGNWELFAQYMAWRGYRVNTIARATFDPRLTRLLKDWRRRAGVITHNRGDRDTMREMLRIFKNGEGLGILMDVDTAVPSLFVPFFGELARTPRSAADLSLRTGAALWLGYTQRLASGRHKLYLQKFVVQGSDDRAADALDLTARLTAAIEAGVRRHPEQWIWTHRRWKSRPPTSQVAHSPSNAPGDDDNAHNTAAQANVAGGAQA